MPTEKRDWKKIVKDSAGNRFHLPEEFEERAQALEDKKEDFRDELEKVAQKEIELNVEQQQLFYDIRKALAEKEVERVWVKDIGFDSDALKDGEFVINLFEEQRGGR